MRARRQAVELARALATTRADLDAAHRDRALLISAFDTLPVGVRVWNEAGEHIVVNAWARRGTGDRQADALLDRAINDTAALAASGRDAVHALDLHQPARRAISIRARKMATGCVVITEDVSERMQIDAVRRDFVANVSHELRTPIGALAVLSETLRDEGDLSVVRRLAERMATESDRAVRLIEDLLDLSRVEAPNREPGQPVRIARVVANAVGLVEDAARTAGVSVIVGDGLGEVEVLGDDRQLVSAVRNLLDNAVKYSSAGDRITVDVSTDAKYVAIRVSDTGIGIPARDMDRVFERFYRVDRARSRQTGGTGLGLAIVRHVAQNHGGDVSVQSVEGQGSTFTLRVAIG